MKNADFYCVTGKLTVAMPVSTLSLLYQLPSNREQEAKILDYQTQQEKLLPQLAAAYAFHFINDYLQELFDNGYREIQRKNFDTLPEVSCSRMHSYSWLALRLPFSSLNIKVF